MEPPGLVAVRDASKERGLGYPGKNAGCRSPGGGWGPGCPTGPGTPGNLTRSPVAAPGRAPVQGVKDDPYDEAKYEDQHVDHCPSRRVWLAWLIVSHIRSSPLEDRLPVRPGVSRGGAAVVMAGRHGRPAPGCGAVRAGRGGRAPRSVTALPGAGEPFPALTGHRSCPARRRVRVQRLGSRSRARCRAARRSRRTR